MTTSLENDQGRGCGDRRPQDRDLDAALAISSVLAPWRAAPGGQEARVGVVCDASASMQEFSGVMASLAWALITGIHHDDSTPVRSVVLRAGHRDIQRIGGIDHHPGLIGPRACPWGLPVPEPAADEPTARLDCAIELADELVGLRTAGPARLLVLISDGRQNLSIRDRTCDSLDYLQRRGCQVLWICPNTSLVISSTFPGARLHLINPRDITGPGPALRALAASTLLGSSVLDALTDGQETQNV